jgi:hypothetical protein
MVLNEISEHQETLLFHRRLYVLWSGLNNRATERNIFNMIAVVTKHLKFFTMKNFHTKNFCMKLFLYVEKHQHDKKTNVSDVLK